MRRMKIFTEEEEKRITKEDLKVLENIFKRVEYPDEYTLDSLFKLTGISQEVLKLWFRKQRINRFLKYVFRNDRAFYKEKFYFKKPKRNLLPLRISQDDCFTPPNFKFRRSPRDLTEYEETHFGFFKFGYFKFKCMKYPINLYNLTKEDYISPLSLWMVEDDIPEKEDEEYFNFISYSLRRMGQLDGDSTATG